MKRLNNDLAFIIIAAVFAASGLLGTFLQKYDTSFSDAELSEKIVTSEVNDDISVHVKGAVKNEGVYKFKEGDRLEDALSAAGGPSDNADTERVNLASFLSDGEEVYFPEKGENFSVTKSGVVNINEADADTLKTIPGISEKLAEKIVQYRDENGKFENKADIINVSGIGEKTYAAIAPYITAG